MIKAFKIAEMGRNFLTQKKSTFKIFHLTSYLMALSLGKNIKISILNTAFQNFTGGPSRANKVSKTNIRYINWKGRGQCVCTCIWHVYVCRRFQESTKTLLELKVNLARPQNTKSIWKSQLYFSILARIN